MRGASRATAVQTLTMQPTSLMHLVPRGIAPQQQHAWHTPWRVEGVVSEVEVVVICPRGQQLREVEGVIIFRIHG